MNTPNKPRSSSAKPTKSAKRSGGGGGGFWLLIATVVLAVAGVYIFAPELPRQWLGIKPPPQDKGSEPTTPQTVKSDLVGKQHTVDDALRVPVTAALVVGGGPAEADRVLDVVPADLPGKAVA